MDATSMQRAALVFGVVLRSLWTDVSAFPTFPAAIPNGLKCVRPSAPVPCPSHFDETQAAQQCALDICKGVGHVDCRGGDHPNAQGEILNSFGKAFQAAGRQWTAELCNEDSDGDGKTNGQELGDPCCVWKPTALATVGEDYRISHPGHARDVTNSPGPTPAECEALQKSLGASKPFDEEEWADEVYLEGETRMNMTFRVQEHTLLPNETMYTRAYFPLKQDKDYYMVGFLADIVNKVHVHHFVVDFCIKPISQLYRNSSRPAGFPEQPVDESDQGFVPEECVQNLYNWAPGGDTFALPDHMAIKFGKSTNFEAVLLEIHYNNPEGVTDEKDSSGFTALITTVPREHEATWWWTGSVTAVGEIPPRKRSFFNTAECIVQLKPECENIYATAYMPHAHFLGTAIWTELYRPDDLGNLQYVRDLGREDQFNYELQYTRMFDEQHEVKNGDVVVATCIFDSMDRTEPTRGGLASQEEMCLNSILVYPATCLYTNQCVTAGRIVSGEVPKNVTSPYQNPNLYALGGSPNFTAVAQQELATCNTETVFNNSQVGPNGNPEDRMFVAFTEQCPGLLDFADYDYDYESFSPTNKLAYECSTQCAEWIINYGVCSVTYLKQQQDQLVSLGIVDPTGLAPPSCFAKVTKLLTERSGGTYTPVQASEIVSSNPSSSLPGQETVAGGDASHAAAPVGLLTCFLGATATLTAFLFTT